MNRSDLPTLLLFDLGKVIMDITGAQDIQKYLVEPWKYGALWPAEATWEAFERGQITPMEFATRFIAEVPLNAEPEVFLEDFAMWSRAILPGSEETLKALRSRFTVAALSNSNEVHWRRNQMLGVPELFDRIFSSHEIGVRKPHPDIFEYALKELGVKPEVAAFFDDLSENVEAAKRLGLRGYRVEGNEELRACLLELGYLDSV